MWVKICANTNLEDTQLAIDFGADAIGFVFAPSARQITPRQAGWITSRLRPGPRATEYIGVFSTSSLKEIRDAISIAGLTGVQLHNVPDPSLITALHREFRGSISLTQTLHWILGGPAEKPAASLAHQAEALRTTGQINRILVDTKAGGAVGGTGFVFDWESARPIFCSAGGTPMIVAGGLNPENVREALKRLTPWGVDVASGVELVPGKKDPERLRLFLERARETVQATAP